VSDDDNTGAFLARDVTSRLCYDASVRLSVTEVHWRIIANLGFKFRPHFTAHCGRRAAGGRRAQWRRAACGRIISRHASQCQTLLPDHLNMSAWSGVSLADMSATSRACRAVWKSLQHPRPTRPIPW